MRADDVIECGYSDVIVCGYSDVVYVKNVMYVMYVVYVMHVVYEMYVVHLMYVVLVMYVTSVALNECKSINIYVVVKHITPIDHNEKDGGIYILPECIATNKSKWLNKNDTKSPND